MIDGKCKEDFEKWYKDNYSNLSEYTLDMLDEFYDLPFEMQSGVYLAFFDSVDEIIEVTKYGDKWMPELIYHNLDTVYFKTRTEALKEAIKQANKIYNEETNT